MAKSSGAASEAEKQKPLYLLGEKIVTTSTSEDKRTLTCRGSISVTVGDTKASKEVNFSVQQSPMARYPFRLIHSSFEPLASWCPRRFGFGGGLSPRICRSL
jgi:hypothetical protein